MGDLGMIKGVASLEALQSGTGRRWRRGTPGLSVAQGLLEIKRGGGNIISNRQTNATICMT